MNLMQVASEIKNLPDATLMKELTNPSGQVPQYLVLSELQRRKQLRQQSAAQKPIDPTPLAQEIPTALAMQNQQGQQGLMQANQNQQTLQGMQPQQGFAGGGLVSFAKGGRAVYDPDTESMVPVGGWGQQGDVIFDPLTEARRSFEDSVSGAVGKAWDMYPPRMLYDAITKGVNPTRVGDKPVGIATPPARVASSAGTRPVMSDDEIFAENGITDASVAGSPTAGMSPGVGSGRGLDALLGMVKSPGSDDFVKRLQSGGPKTQSRAEIAAERKADKASRGLDTPALQKTEQLLAEMQKQEGNRGNNVGLALLKAGAAMAATKSPYLLQAVGEGANAGIDEYTKAEEARKKAMLVHAQLQATIEQGRRAEAMGDMKAEEEAYQHAQKLSSEYKHYSMVAEAQMRGHETSGRGSVIGHQISADAHRASAAASLGKNPQLEIIRAIADNPKLAEAYGKMHGIEPKQLTAASSIIKAANTNPLEWGSPEQKRILRAAEATVASMLGGGAAPGPARVRMNPDGSISQ